MSPVKAKVIMVEDDDYVRAAAKKELSQAGHSLIFEAADYKTASGLIEKLQQAPDVALVDSRFPFKQGEGDDDHSGPSIANTIKRKFPETQIVFFSSREQQEFGTHRFPEPNIGKGSQIEGNLGRFITSLPGTRR